MLNILIIPDINNIYDSVRLADEWNLSFEYDDFFMPDILDDYNEVKRRIGIYKGLGRDRSNDTLHGAFLDVTIHSSDRRIAEIASKRIHSSMDIASELGVRGVVFHTNIIPNFRNTQYIENWIEKNASFWKQIIEEYPGICIYMENMFDAEYTYLEKLSNKMRIHEQFEICLDYAHLSVFGNGSPLEWVANLAPYIGHMHINDNDLKNDLHMAVGDGQIDWNIFAGLIREYNIDSSVLIEVEGYRNQVKSLEYLKRNNIIPFA